MQYSEMLGSFRKYMVLLCNQQFSIRIFCVFCSPCHHIKKKSNHLRRGEIRGLVRGTFPAEILKSQLLCPESREQILVCIYVYMIWIQHMSIQYIHAKTYTLQLHFAALETTCCALYRAQHTATHCNTLQHTATHCNTLQHTATHFAALETTCFENHLPPICPCVLVRVPACWKKQWLGSFVVIFECISPSHYLSLSLNKSCHDHENSHDWFISQYYTTVLEQGKNATRIVWCAGGICSV